MIRTTLEIDDAVLAAARALAAESRTSVGAALSRLALRGLTADSVVRSSDGFPVFASAVGAPPITLEVVNAHRDG